MQEIRLDSSEDAALDVFRELKSRRVDRASEGFVVEGRHLVERLLRSRLECTGVLLAASHARRLAPDLRGLLDARAPAVWVLDDAAIEELVGFPFHRGWLAAAKRPLLDDGASWLENARTILAIDGVGDAENLGSLVRTARALGADGLLLGERAGDVFSRRSVRVSMGGVFDLPITRSVHLADDLRRLRDAQGLQVLAALASDDAQSPQSLALGERCALVVGSESDGIAADVLAVADARVSIPMARGADSLNVAVAAGILLWELVRQRG